MSNNYAKWIKFRDELSVMETEFMKTVNNINPGLAEKKGVCGRWFPKEVVAHITGWEKEVREQFGKILKGTAVPVNYDIDAYNQKSVASRAHLSWPEVIKELEEAQKELQQFNNSLDEEKITGDKRFTYWVVVLLKHYKHHNEQIKGFVRKK